MQSSRLLNTKRNIIWSYLDSGINFIFKFVSRSVIVYVLGSQYLGLSSLFSSILGVLSMAELGFSSAITYNMYKPLAEDDTETVCGLLAYYKRIYRVIGCIILAAGIVIIPFLPRLIKGTWPETVNIYLLYLLYLANTAVSYFLFAYKTSLLHAIQRMDLVKMAYSAVNVLECIVKILVLLLFRNYYAFVIVSIIGTAVKNIIADQVAKKRFPQYECRGTPTAEMKQDIILRVKGMMVNKISGVTYTTFDSIILSSMIGLTTVAIYGNYMTLLSSAMSIVSLLRNAMQASVGNSIAVKTRADNYRDIRIIQFLFSMIATVCVTCMLCLFQPIMALWMGDDMLLGMKDVIILCAWFMVSTVQHAFYLYLSGNGLWWELRWPYILSTVVNIVLNIVLCRIWGITGIILATLIAVTVFGLFWQCIIIFREYFGISAKDYLIRQMLYFLVAGYTGGIAWFFCRFVSNRGIPGVLMRLAICLVVAGLSILVTFGKTEVFRDSKKIAIRMLKR